MQVIFCAAARTTFTGELNRVDAAGVSNVASSMQDELFRRTKAKGGKYSPFAKKEVADFARVYHQLRWDVEFVGVMVSGQWVSGVCAFAAGHKKNHGCLASKSSAVVRVLGASLGRPPQQCLCFVVPGAGNCLGGGSGGSPGSNSC